MDGTPGRIRTYDKLIKSQLLYQLSYGGMFETKQRWREGVLIASGLCASSFCPQGTTFGKTMLAAVGVSGTILGVFRLGAWYFSPMRVLLFILLVSMHTALAAELQVVVTFAGQPGPYTIKRWKHDWPGCGFEGGIAQGRVAVVENNALNWLRVNFAVGGIGPEQGGAGWRMPFGKHEAAELSYTLCFSKDFDFVKGGKLPGLCGGPDNISGGRRATGTNGFSARLMWRKDGRGEAYIYHKNQKGDYGDSFAFPAGFRFPTEIPVKVRIAVTMNAVGKRDGTLRVWIDEKPMVERTDMEWRTVDSFGVDGLYFETFHGGGDASWAPTRACWAEFAEMKVGG